MDITNSPHVVIFRPLIARMRAQGHEVTVTAREFAQTIGLLERFGIDHVSVGAHGGRLERGQGAGDGRPLGGPGAAGPARAASTWPWRTAAPTSRWRRAWRASPRSRCSTTSTRR